MQNYNRLETVMNSNTLQANEEAARLAALDALAILDTAPENEYDALTRLAAFICDTPVSLVSLVSADRQFFKSAHGFARRETPRELSFCAHTLGSVKTLLVEDVRKDARFAQNSLVTGDPGIRFYAGAPIVDGGGHVLGTLCVIDQVPRALTAEQISALESLAYQASKLLEARWVAREKSRLEVEAVTARNAAEAQRKALQSALDAVGIAVWFYDPDRNFIGGDARMQKLFGLGISEGPVELWLASISEEDRARVGKEFAASLAGAPHDTKFRVSVDGEIRWLHSRAKIAPDARGALRMTGVCEDVTREEELTAELNRTQSRLALAQEASGAVSFDWNCVEDVLVWNAPFILGRPAEQLGSAAAYFAQVHADDADKLRGTVDAALKQGAAYYEEFRLHWPDGSVHWVSTSARAVRNEHGAVASVLGVNLDITDRKLSEEALLRTEKLAAVGRLASVISHEINNPLEAVTNLLYIVRMSPNLSRQDKNHLELADRELARVAHITAQTLRFHKNPSTPRQIEASVMLRELLALYRTRLTASGIEVRLDLGKDVNFHAYEGDVRQVLNNLVGNAFDAMRKGGVLRIRARCSTDAATGIKGASIAIADSGSGIPASARQHIFEAFHSTKGIGGTGLGLWISKRIVHKHKGHLRFRSKTGANAGTVFRLWLPDQAASTAAEGWA